MGSPSSHPLGTTHEISFLLIQVSLNSKVANEDAIWMKLNNETGFYYVSDLFLYLSRGWKEDGRKVLSSKRSLGKQP